MRLRSWMILPWLGLASVAAAETELYTPKRYVPPAAASPLERLGEQDIIAVVLMNKPDIIQCAKAQEEKDPGKAGTLRMSWAIRKDGTTHKVRCATPELCDTVLAKCLTKEIRTWTFPRHEIEGDSFSFPFPFSGSKSAPVLERLSPSDIDTVVRKKRPGVTRCVSAHKKQSRSSGGRVLMSWAIRKDGTTHRVKCATPELCDEPVVQCWVKEISTWTFPRHKIEGEPTVLPFAF